MLKSSIAQLDNNPIWAQISELLDKVETNDTLLILPPFAGVDRPSLGLHTLQACAKQRGHRAHVLYANLFFALLLGEKRYESLCYAPTSDLLGERIFAFAAYSRSSLDLADSNDLAFRTSLRALDVISEVEMLDIQWLASEFVVRLAKCIVQRGIRVVGCNTTFEQTSASIAILAELKNIDSSIITLIGGANCEGTMASGIRELCPSVDYLFSGESESTFPEFLDSIPNSLPPRRSIIDGTPCNNLDAIPNLDYGDYYEQLTNLSTEGFLLQSGSIWLPYETSRGCWWGQKHHCTFCGINGGGMTFRQKSPQMVLDQLPALLKKHPTNKVLMVDNIMPADYFETLLPELVSRALGMHAFYEQKANLSLKRVSLLKRAGVAIIQPGIESLSSDLLRMMKKGVSASQNIALLRYAKSVDLSVNWNLLYAFPGDKEEHYERTLEIIPLLQHLNPPSGACHLSLDRFSPYFDHPSEYGIENVRPMEAYGEIFPESTDVASIAYHFVGDYSCATRRDLTIVPRLESAVEAWRSAWNNPDTKPPVLAIEEVAAGVYLLCDTRLLNNSENRFQFINTDQAMLALTSNKICDIAPELVQWAAVESRVATELDGRLTPLATARPELIETFEALSKRYSGRDGRDQIPVIMTS